MKKKLISSGVIIVFTLLTVYIFVTNKEIGTLAQIADQINYGWLGVAVLLMVVYYLFNTRIIWLISKELACGMTFWQSLYMSFVGQYYSLVTPFASGGQPAQIYAMQKKYGIPVAKGTAIAVKKFIVYQVVVSLFATVFFFARIHYIVTSYGTILFLIIIGLIVNLVGGALLLMIAYNSEKAKSIVLACLRFFKKIKLFRKLEEGKIGGQIDDYGRYIDEIKSNKKTMIRLIVYTLLQLIVYFSISYYVYKSLGQNNISYIDIMSIQTIVYVIISFVPTPGSVGASEGTFYLLYRAFFSKDILLYGMAIWRIIIFYLNILVSGSVIGIDYIRTRIALRKRVPAR